jgi:hypothetical protein
MDHHRFLIVGHRTLGGEHLIDHLRSLHSEDPTATFHVIVPVHHPLGHAWTDGEVEDQARQNLEEMLVRLKGHGFDATGEIGDANPVTAIADVLIRDGVHTYRGVIVSTLPERHSLWWDVPSRIGTTFADLPMTHLVSDEAFA